MKPLVAEILAVVQTRCGKGEWTAEFIKEHLDWKRRLIGKPEVSIRRVRECLKTLVDLALIYKNAQKDGRVQWNTFGPIWPEPVVPELIFKTVTVWPPWWSFALLSAVSVVAGFVMRGI